MTPVSRPIIALGILNVDAGRYSFDARAKSLVAQDLLLLLQSTKTPLTASAENSLFQDVFSVIEPANAARKTRDNYICGKCFHGTFLVANVNSTSEAFKSKYL